MSVRRRHTVPVIRRDDGVLLIRPPQAGAEFDPWETKRNPGSALNGLTWVLAGVFAVPVVLALVLLWVLR